MKNRGRERDRDRDEAENEGDADEFFDGIEDEEAYEGRVPRLGLGVFEAEVKGTSVRRSENHRKDYFEFGFELLDSDSPGFPEGSEACVQVWEAPYKIHLKKLKGMLQAFFPDRELTGKLCAKLIKEDLLCGKKIFIRCYNNSKGYPEYEFKSTPFAKRSKKERERDEGDDGDEEDTRSSSKKRDKRDEDEDRDTRSSSKRNKRDRDDDDDIPF